MTDPVALKTRSTLTCPLCGHAKTEDMPEDACVHFF